MLLQDLLEMDEYHRRRMALMRQKKKDKRIEKETGKKPRHSALGIDANPHSKKTGTFVPADDK